MKSMRKRRRRKRRRREHRNGIDNGIADRGLGVARNLSLVLRGGQLEVDVHLAGGGRGVRRRRCRRTLHLNDYRPACTVIA